MLFTPVALLLAASSPVIVSAFPAFANGNWPTRASSGSVRGAGPVLRRAAASYSPEFPYTGAILNGLNGTGVGGVHVPAPGDFAHYFEEPPVGAQRGPCPGLNTLANHGFLSRDGITTYTELVAGLQNAYNVQWEVAVVLSVFGIAYDGDPVTEMLSIGDESTQLTGAQGMFTGNPGGLDRHGTFELDVSLTRSDFYLHGDSHSFNATLFQMMAETAASTSSAEDPLFDFNAMALYRYQRYQQSRADNPYLYYPELALHNYAAATFLYNTFPSSSNNYKPDLPTIASFFGAVPLPDGTYASQPERFPPGWSNAVAPLNLTTVGNGVQALFDAYPTEFGANQAGVWVPLNTNSSASSRRKRDSISSGIDGCGVYETMLAIADCAPQPVALTAFIAGKLNPIFEPMGCQITPVP